LGDRIATLMSWLAGHDACRLEETGGGWRLAGVAVFLHERSPAQLAYEVVCDREWRSREGRVRGWLGARTVELSISRSPGGAWMLDGAPVPGLETGEDLDFGFTPATNLFQLRRLALATGQARDCPVAWLDDAARTFTPLPAIAQPETPPPHHGRAGGRVQPVRQTVDKSIMRRLNARSGLLVTSLVVGLVGCGPDGGERFDDPIPDTLVFEEDGKIVTAPLPPEAGGWIGDFNSPQESLWLTVPQGVPSGFVLVIERGSTLEPGTYHCDPYTVAMRLSDDRGWFTSEAGRCRVTITRIQREPTPRVTGTFSGEVVGTIGQGARTLTNGRFDFVPRLE
jgi:hypothetical protein